MELRQLQTFLTITQMESFSKAAQILGYSQSAVTVQIRLLEEELNTRLFDRLGKGVVLTSNGQQFVSYANNILQEMNRAMHFTREDETLHQPLHIGTLESLCFTKLPAVLHYFRENYPRVPIRITTATPKELIEKMEHNHLDIIYFLDRSRYNEKWNKVMEVEEPIVFVASASSLLAKRSEIPVAELIQFPFFLTEKDENYRRELDHYLESKGLSLTPFLEISNTEFIIKMIRENRGVSYLPYFAVKDCIEAGKLSVLNVPEFQKSLYRQIFYHKNKWKTREMEAFIRLTLEDAEEEDR